MSTLSSSVPGKETKGSNVRAIYLMRHAEREDRASEAAGLDWISTAPRPHDPRISEEGRQQAVSTGRQLRGAGITKILCSPLIRAVMTADLVAAELGLGPDSIHVEQGLVEQAKSFRGKTSDEPRPNWNPLLFSAAELAPFSDRLNLRYPDLQPVRHLRDDSVPNTVVEEHARYTYKERDLVTEDRCSSFLTQLIAGGNGWFSGETVLCVGHGASLKYCTKFLESGLPLDRCIAGSQDVSCFAGFQPDEATGQWSSFFPCWRYGRANEVGGVGEDADDRGDL